ncbi:GNAT family N-acetyltransferase [Stakelama sp. CBK3Z-3]|uniref:GNAT family N-acetyltransferase n=1 Tax=Stakelama flava TaxID=2860338 RepID=A0ABS6XPM7_9SPHN|nr:GNAT family N-acetyltransferase [Stakelama flava]MBW4331834.1 GNAT family N-acetyltransferase [Stakelama flava]
MSPAAPLPLRFQVGARTLFSLERTLVRVALSLDDVLNDRAPVLPPLPGDAHGYLVTSLPADRLLALTAARSGDIAFIRQRYVRYHVDLTIGFDAWLAGLSANVRSQLRRKTKRLAARSGGAPDIRACRTPDEMAAFHTIARGVAAKTYQELLMGAGIPGHSAFTDQMARLAAADQVRGWLLYIDGEPAAYLYCPVRGDTLIYEYVGHDPAFSALSPGMVLQFAAFEQLFAEDSFRRFDFTEGEGQHKRQMASSGIDCLDLLLLRGSFPNRALIAALGGFDHGVGAVKKWIEATPLGSLAKRIRRG